MWTWRVGTERSIPAAREGDGLSTVPTRSFDSLVDPSGVDSAVCLPERNSHPAYGFVFCSVSAESGIGSGSKSLIVDSAVNFR